MEHNRTNVYGRLLVAASESNSDLLYATNFLVPDSVIYLEWSHKRYLILNELEFSRGKKEARVDEVLSLKKWGERVRERLNIPESARINTHQIIAEICQSWGIDCLEVPADFPMAMADHLRALHIELFCNEDAFFPERAFKKDFEINAIREVQEKNERGMNHLLQIIADSEIISKNEQALLFYQKEILTSEKMQREYAKFMLDLDCQVDGTIVSCGPASADPHALGQGPLFAHQSIILDLFPRDKKTRYWGDMTRTVVKGKASPQLKKMWQTVKQGQEKTIDQLKDGVDSKKLHCQLTEFFAANGFPTEERSGMEVGFIHGTGHGVGLDIHELPRFNKTSGILRTNQVVTVEPGLYYPEIGGVRIEDIVVIEKNGCQNLNQIPKILEID